MLQILSITNVQHIYGKVFRFQGTRPVSTIVIKLILCAENGKENNESTYDK